MSGSRRFEFLQRLVDREHIVRGRLQDGARLVQLLALPAAALLRPGLAARLFDQDVAHGPRGGEEEVLPAFPGHVAIAGDPQVDLVDQRRRLQGLAGRLPCQSRPRELVQLGIDQRQEIRRRLPVPGLRRLEHRGHLGVAREGHRWPSKREQ